MTPAKIRGSMAVPLAAACMARETHRRAMLLEVLRRVVTSTS